MELSWRPRGAFLERSWGRLRGPLGPSWAPLGPFGRPLGPSWGPLGGLLGRLGAMFEASSAILEGQKPENAGKQKTMKKTMKIYDFGLLGLSWKASRSAPGASWGPLGP